MYSLEEELGELAASGDLQEVDLAPALACERRTLLSVSGELRIAMYAAVAMVVSGLGILVKQNLDRIGPLTLMLVLALVGAACYVPAIRSKLRTGSQSRTAEYLLLLGTLIVSVDVGYAESQFHWLGPNWSRHLLLLTAFHATVAYVLRSELVLAVALTSLAGWFGVERGAGNLAPWSVATPELGARAMLCAAVVLAWRAMDLRVAAGRFRNVFAHFIANLAFWGAVGWCSESSTRLVGVLVVLLLGAGAIRFALRTRMEAFAVYGICYAAFGLSAAWLGVTKGDVAGAAVVLVIVLSAAAALRHLHDALKDDAT